MELRNINKKEKGTSPPPKKKKKKGLPVYRAMTYEYEMNEEVVLTEEGKKQVYNLKKSHYRVIEIYLANLGDMSAWMMRLNEEDDENIVNPYLANFFKPKNPRTE